MKYDNIRCFEPQDLPAAYDRLAADPQFKAVIGQVFPNVPFEALVQKMKACKTNLDFQLAFCYDFLKDLLAKASKGISMDSSSLDVTKRYTFVSNHRDIVLDSALLDVLLVDAGFKTTCEIAIGDNLLATQWIKDLVRVNKSFLVLRSAGLREMLTNSKQLSEYMHHVIADKHDNIWIAQREGRAKDSDDRTQQSILKMMAMGGEGSAIERLKQLHIVPLSISYEYDPCDYLKTMELHLKRNNPEWKKTKEDDVFSMRTGIMGYKGEIHYHCAPCIDSYLDSLPTDMPKGELFATVAEYMDQQIHSGYRLYPCNYIAIDMLNRKSDYSEKYTEKEKATFCRYIADQLAKIGKHPQPSPIEWDIPFLIKSLLSMYANPAINKMKSELTLRTK